MIDKEPEICAEYIVGCCLKDEFISGEITKKCLKVHSKELRNDYIEAQKIKQRYLNDSIYTFESIINDVEAKITQHKRMILPKIPENITKSLEKVEELIESSNVDNFASVYSLLKLHGELVTKAENNEIISNFDVCTICGAFKKDNSECAHTFCKSYKKIRETLKNCKILNQKIQLN